MAKQKCPECPQCLPGWLVQFADLMSLLLVFFVLLLSMAVMDKKKVEEYISVMKKSMGFISEDTETTERKQAETDGESDGGGSGQDDGSGADNDEAAEAVEEIVQEMNSESTQEMQQVEMTKGQNEFSLDIPSTLMFEDGEYELTHKGAKKFIAKIARVIRTMPQTFDIEVMGHTDRSPYTSKQIPRDNWDVSALRAIAVVKELIKNKIDPAQLKVSAFSQYHPKSDMANENRRVELKFIANQDQTDLLGEENFFDRLEQ
ncbi:MAG: flagellar motor protein MotB [Campylobacterota bacterium]|nr:flagellar motor protein MotB [Campylobacterota bacterium]